MKVKKIYLTLLPYLVLCFAIFLFFAIPSLDGLSEVKIYADSGTYEKMYKENSEIEGGTVQVSMNYLGPLTVLNMFSGNRYLIFIFNFILLTLSIVIIKRSGLIKDNRFYWFVILSPLTLVSTLAVNKEILSILAISFLILWISKRKLIYFIFALVLSYTVRWQLSLFIVAAALAIFGRFYLKLNRKLIIFCVLISVSSFYYLLMDFFSAVVAVAFNNVEEVGKSGIYTKLNELQGKNYFGYVLAFIPKVLQLNLGLLSRYDNFGDLNAAHNSIIMFLHALFTLILVSYLVFYKKMRFDNIMFFIIMIYLIIFALSPIYSPRYFYPAYIMGAVLLSSSTSKCRF